MAVLDIISFGKMDNQLFKFFILDVISKYLWILDQ